MRALFVLVGLLGTPLAPGFGAGIAHGQPLERSARVEDPAALGVGRTIPDLDFTPLSGPPRTLSALLDARPGVRGAVLVFTSTGCPISRGYAPRAAALARDYAEKGIIFIHINAVPAETPAEMGEFIREAGLIGPYVIDRELKAAAALGARTTAEVFLIDAARRLVYRGAIDDQRAVGAARNTARTEFLRDALDALLAGREPVVRATWAPGCLLDVETGADPVDAGPAGTPAWSGPPPTYHGKIAGILARNCVSCHRNGGVAPFSLESPGLIQGRARMIDAVVRDRLMPPSHGTPIGPRGEAADSFQNARELASDDRAALRAWIAANRPLGDARTAEPLPALPPSPSTWRIGPPDTILMTPGLELPLEGPMLHQRSIVPTAFTTDRRVSAMEFRSQPPTAVQVAQVWLIPPGAPLPGTRDLPPAPPAEFLGACSVSDTVIDLGSRTPRLIPAGSVLLVDIYARPMGKRMFSSLRIGFRDAASESPPADHRRAVVLSPAGFWIDAGSADTLVRAEHTLDRAARVEAITPVMRSRGRRFRLEAILPSGGEPTVLLETPNYDWRWQIRYELGKPIELPAGTRLIASGQFDSSEGNPARLERGPALMGVDPADEAMLGVIELIESGDAR